MRRGAVAGASMPLVRGIKGRAEQRARRRLPGAGGVVGGARGRGVAAAVVRSCHGGVAATHADVIVRCLHGAAAAVRYLHGGVAVARSCHGGAAAAHSCCCHGGATTAFVRC
jgi:hypothetical protein